MSKPRVLSFSGTQTYLECGHKFKLSYIEKIRPLLQPSYFVFGSAVDKGLNALLAGEGSGVKELATELERVKNEHTEFFDIDYDGELIPEEKKSELLIQCHALGYGGDSVDALASALLSKPATELSENQRKALALLCFNSLYYKGCLMIEAYKRQVLPLIQKVEGVQQEIRWKDANDNEFIGILDLPATLHGHGSVIADNKTSSRPYEMDSVRSSPQLAIYSSVTGHKKAAFFVMEKRIRKNRIKTCSKCGNDGTGKRHKTCDVEANQTRCNGEWSETIRPEVNLQIIVDDVNPLEQKITQESMSGVAEAIKVGQFPKNFKMCRQKFGQKEVKCPYFNFCRTGDMSGLEKKREEIK